MIDAALIDRAAQDLGVQVPAAKARPVTQRSGMAIGLLALTFLAAAVASWIFRDSLAAFQQRLDLPPLRAAPAREVPEPIRPLPLPPPAPPPADNVPARPPV